MSACRRQLQSWLFGIAVGILAARALPALSDESKPPFVTTPDHVVERMLALAKLSAADTLIDLGSGDGRIVIYAAKHFNARAIGIEMVPALVEQSRQNALKAGVGDRVRFVAQDALAADLREATVLTLYLSPELNFKLMPRILATMRPGARVVSHDFGIGAWTPDAVEHFEVAEKNDGRGGESAIFLWIVPADVVGRWQATLGEGSDSRSFEFSVAQQFQFIDGAVHAHSGNLPLRSASLRGDRIAFELPPELGLNRDAEVSAQATGDEMLGIARRGPNDPAPLNFKARRISTRPDLYQ